MHKIKQTPDDFIVKEITNIKFCDDGDYSCFLMKKRDYTTSDAIRQIAGKLGINEKRIGYAGNKDKTAVTEQYISIFKADFKELKLKDIKLSFVGKRNEPISLGDLKGNCFEIVVGDLSKKVRLNKQIKIINYFGEQRFSNNNSSVGKAILKKDFKKAVELILENKGFQEETIKDYLAKKLNDYVGALRTMPKNVLMLYLHSYQSYLWNKTAEKLKKEKQNIKIPIIGFGTETDDKKIKDIIEKIMKEECITYRDFIIKEIPELTSEGNERELFVEINDLNVVEQNKDSAKLSFSLPKGSYATVAIKQLFKNI